MRSHGRRSSTSSAGAKSPYTVRTSCGTLKLRSRATPAAAQRGVYVYVYVYVRCGRVGRGAGARACCGACARGASGAAAGEAQRTVRQHRHARLARRRGIRLPTVGHADRHAFAVRCRGLLELGPRVARPPEATHRLDVRLVELLLRGAWRQAREARPAARGVRRVARGVRRARRGAASTSFPHEAAGCTHCTRCILCMHAAPGAPR